MSRYFEMNVRSQLVSAFCLLKVNKADSKETKLRLGRESVVGSEGSKYNKELRGLRMFPNRITNLLCTLEENQYLS